MRSIYTIIIFVFPLIVFCQVGIGTSTPHAQLDIVAESPDNPSVIDGILIPRIKKFPSPNPGDDQNGMLVYLTSDSPQFKKGFYYWNSENKNWEGLGGSSTGGFHKTGSSESPQTIDEPAYRTGNLGIGTRELSAKLQIVLNSQADIAIKKGLEVDNNNPATDNLTTYGIISDNRSATNGTKYGIKNNVGGMGLGVHYGIFNEAYQNSGTNDIYGIFNRVGRTFGSNSNNYGIYTQIGTVQGSGNIYGIYSSALGDHNAKVYAGYFVGRVGIGMTPQEEYRFPAVKGKTDQILTLDNTGNMNWTYPNTQNYSTTGSAIGEFVITDEISSLRINDQVSSLRIPPANANKGRIITLIAWKGTKTKPFNFSGNNDDIYDVVNDVSLPSISGSQVLTIQSAGNIWIVLNIRKAP